jgi:hypothetical protein
MKKAAVLGLCAIQREKLLQSLGVEMIRAP